MKGLAAVGDVLAGKYRVDKILGIGGMGMVVAATHLELDQRVALKFMLPGALESAEASARFLREARAAGRLNSDHVCRVMDVGRFDTGVPYIVMEYLQGENLAALLRRRGPLRVSDAVDFVLQGIEGLAEAHAHGIIHRDLKPDNLFLHKRNDGGSLVKVLDFGISKFSGGHSTKTGDIMGSPAYMAPEQMESTRSVDHRADVWSLGVVLYQLVTAKPPFQGDTLPLLCLHVVNDAPLPMSAIRGDLPEGFEAVVMKCLEKEPADRFVDVGQLAQALAPFGPKNATTSASRIQIVLTRSSKDSVASLSHEFTTASPTMDHQGAPPPIRPERSAPIEATTLGSTSGQSIPTMRTERGSRGLVIGVIAALGVVALAVGMVWPSDHGEGSLDPARPTGAPVAAPAVRPAPIVEPIVEPIHEPAEARSPVAEPEVPPTAAQLATVPRPVVDAGPKRTRPKAEDRRRPKVRRPGATPARPAQAGSAGGSAAPDEDTEDADDDKWDHMTHDENKP